MIGDVVNDFAFVEAAWCSYQPYLDHYLTCVPHVGKELVLDNSTHLLGKPMVGGYLVRLVQKFHHAGWAVTLVIPDVKNDPQETVRLSHEFFDDYSTDLPSGICLMVVGHGHDMEAWGESVAMLTEECNAGRSDCYITIGLPYIMRWGILGYVETRRLALEYIERNFLEVTDRVHFLGHSYPREMILYRCYDGKLSLYHDTSAAYGYASCGASLDSVELETARPEPIGVIDSRLLGDNQALFVNNMALLRNYCG